MTHETESKIFTRKAYVYFALHGIPNILTQSTGSGIVTLDFTGPPPETILFTEKEFNIVKRMIMEGDAIKNAGATSITIISLMWLREDGVKA